MHAFVAGLDIAPTVGRMAVTALDAGRHECVTKAMSGGGRTTHPCWPYRHGRQDRGTWRHVTVHTSDQASVLPAQRDRRRRPPWGLLSALRNAADVRSGRVARITQRVRRRAAGSRPRAW